jgi:hypothetical protein
MIERMTVERLVAGVTLAVTEPSGPTPDLVAPTYTVAGPDGRALTFRDREVAEAAFNEALYAALGLD